jgi:DNA-binding MarR family transcriptional regulator
MPRRRSSRPVSANPASASAARRRGDSRRGGRARAESVDARALIAPPVRELLDRFRLEDVGSHLLRRAHFLAEDIFPQEFASESITPRQKAALVTIYQQPGLNQNALADRLFMDRNTVAEMVRRLALNGLVRRVQAAGDQRAYELFLAPAGAAMLERVMPRDARVEQLVLERLPEEYRALFVKCLRLIVEPRATREPLPPSSD